MPKWTSDAPKVEGGYWFRFDHERAGEFHAVCVYRDEEGSLNAGGETFHLDDLRIGMWAGPVEEPYA